MAGLRRLWRPVAEARGVPRWILVIGIAIVALFVILAVFAPLAPYGFDQVRPTASFAKQEAPSSSTCSGPR